MPTNPILICARSPELQAELANALSAAGHEVQVVMTPADAVAAMRSRQPDIVVAEGLAASGAIASLRTGGSSGITPVLVVAPAQDVEARIAFLEAGADDVIDGGFDPNELEGRVMALLIRAGKLQPDMAARSTSHDLVAFFSPKGGVGTTTLAVNTAVLLAGGGAQPQAGANGAEPNIPASRVLLIDLDLQFGQVATHLNLQPRFDLGGLATDEQALSDPELARSYLTVHSSGVSVRCSLNAIPLRLSGSCASESISACCSGDGSIGNVVANRGSSASGRPRWKSSWYGARTRSSNSSWMLLPVVRRTTSPVSAPITHAW